MYCYNKTQLLCITGVMQRKWIFLWVPVIVKGMIADSEDVLYNNPVNIKCMLRKEVSMARAWRG